MSEYQYYEFLAIDRALDDDEQDEIRSLSTTARITTTSFADESHSSDFQGDPNRLMERFYDAHLYVADWGTHRLMVRLPCDLLEPELVDEYCVDDLLNAWVTDEFVVLDFTSEDHAGDFDDEADASLSALVGVRAELAAGDLRPLYLAWLAAYGAWEREDELFGRDADDNLEPSVPAGLGTLTTAQRALADFLRIDDDLLAIAAQASPSLGEVADDSGDLAAWVTHLPVDEKDGLLARVVQGEAAQVRVELLRRYRGEAPSVPAPTRRTVADLLDDTARRRADQEHEVLAQRTNA